MVRKPRVLAGRVSWVQPEPSHRSTKPLDAPEGYGSYAADAYTWVPDVPHSPVTLPLSPVLRRFQVLPFQLSTLPFCAANTWLASLAQMAPVPPVPVLPASVSCEPFQSHT